MSEPNRPTAVVVEMKDTIEYPPQAGNRYLVVTLGGCFTQVEWRAGYEDFYICAMPYPKVPEASKKRFLAQYKP